MASATILTERLRIAHPIIQAPLAGGGDTPGQSLLFATPGR